MRTDYRTHLSTESNEKRVAKLIEFLVNNIYLHIYLLPSNRLIAIKSTTDRLIKKILQVG